MCKGRLHRGACCHVSVLAIKLFYIYIMKQFVVTNLCARLAWYWRWAGNGGKESDSYPCHESKPGCISCSHFTGWATELTFGSSLFPYVCVIYDCLQGLSDFLEAIFMCVCVCVNSKWTKSPFLDGNFAEVHVVPLLTLIVLTWRIGWAHNNARK